MNRLAGPRLCIVVVLNTMLALSTTNCAAESIVWKPWSEAVFEQARKENRFVLLNLEAVWCHWCHVMEEQTYRDDAVKKLLQDHYIAIKVDQDARPDLSRRYEDYRWPATIVFAADGKEIVKRSGYVPAPRFASLLAAIVKDPTPVKYRDSEPPQQYSTSPLLAADIRSTLKANFVGSHDFRARRVTPTEEIHGPGQRRICAHARQQRRAAGACAASGQMILTQYEKNPPKRVSVFSEIF